MLLLIIRAGPLFASTAITASDTGACTTAGACLMLAVPANSASSGFNISGTFSATIQFEGCIENCGTAASWVAINAFPLNSTTAVTSATGTGAWRVTASGLTQIRMRCSTYVSGTANVSITFSLGASANGSGGGGGGTGTVNSCATADLIGYYAAIGTAVSCDALLSDNGTTLIYSGTGGIEASGGPFSAAGPVQAGAPSSCPACAAELILPVGTTNTVPSGAFAEQSAASGSGLLLTQLTTPGTGFVYWTNVAGVETESLSAGFGSAPGWLQYFGNGADGALSYSSGTNNLNTSPYYPTTFTCSGTTTIQVNGGNLALIIRASQSITIGAGCTISVNGTGAGHGDMGGSGASGGGGTAASAVGNSTEGWAASTGGAGTVLAGGAASATLGGAGNNGNSSTSQTERGWLDSGSIPPEYKSSCGAGGSAGGSSGGAAGASGGCIILIAPVINLASGATFTANGTAGGAAPGNATGGGGGGGGGTIIIRSPALTDSGATFSVAGGAGGGCSSFTTCGAGGTGGNGWSIELTQ